MIGKRMEAAVVTKQEIDEAREAYRTVATRGSIIYFVIADMARTRRPAVPRRLHAIFMNRLRESRWSRHRDAPRMTWSPRWRLHETAPPRRRS